MPEALGEFFGRLLQALPVLLGPLHRDVGVEDVLVRPGAAKVRLAPRRARRSIAGRRFGSGGRGSRQRRRKRADRRRRVPMPHEVPLRATARPLGPHRIGPGRRLAPPSPRPVFEPWLWLSRLSAIRPWPARECPPRAWPEAERRARREAAVRTARPDRSRTGMRPARA